MRAQSLAATASAGVSHEPPQTFTFGSARNCGAVSTVMPPVGQNTMSVNGPASADGYTFLKFFPAVQAGGIPMLKALACITSLLVAMPGSSGRPSSRQARPIWLV